ncbi:MAG: hypothetical protein D6824_09455 [Planctomycetota bacterium]|nr:MAG: hypothetical protein D6824_09455 [Planctomycetota bacterium]
MKFGAMLNGANWGAVGAVAAGVGVGAVLVVAGGLIDVTPQVQSEPLDSPVEQTQLNPEHAQVVEGLKALIESCHGLLAVSDNSSVSSGSGMGVGGATTSLTLWARDDAAPGVVNLGEVLVISHRPVLGAVTATTFGAEATSDNPGPAAPSLLYTAPDPVTALRSRFASQTHVIATGVQAVTVKVDQQNQQGATLSITLTWEDSQADAPATFVAHVPRQR